MKQLTHWIDGKSVTGESDRTSPVYDPATGEQTGVVHLADVADVDCAVASAAAAFPAWRATSLSRRADLLFALRQVLDANHGELAAVVTAGTARCCPTPPGRWPAASRTWSSPAASRP